MTSNSHVTSLLISLVKVRKNYYDRLTCSDRTQLKQWIEKLKKLEYVPEHNDHFVICPWSRDGATEGPDTCVCNTPALIEWKLNRMLGEYKLTPSCCNAL